MGATRDTQAAGEVLRAYAALQVEALLALEPGLRSAGARPARVAGSTVLDAPSQVLTRPLRSGASNDDSVHDARTATRRLRAVLSLGRQVFDTELASALSVGLRDLGRLLGQVRDPAVMLEAMRARWSEEPLELVVGPVARRVSSDRTAARRRAITALRRYLDSAAYAELRAGLERLAAETPPGPWAGRPARRVLRRRAGREWRRLALAAGLAAATPPGPARDEALHALRKQARRCRYAAEIAEPLFGRRARRSARRAQAVQDRLGSQHDAVLLREHLVRLGAAAHEAGHSAFTYGRWHAQEQAAADRLELRGLAAARRALAPRHRRWMR